MEHELEQDNRYDPPKAAGRGKAPAKKKKPAAASLARASNKAAAKKTSAVLKPKPKTKRPATSASNERPAKQAKAEQSVKQQTLDVLQPGASTDRGGTRKTKAKRKVALCYKSVADFSIDFIRQ